MFLPPDKWSPRYEQQFYTVEMNKYTKLDKDPTTGKTGSVLQDRFIAQGTFLLFSTIFICKINHYFIHR